MGQGACPRWFALGASKDDPADGQVHGCLKTESSVVPWAALPLVGK